MRWLLVGAALLVAALAGCTPAGEAEARVAAEQFEAALTERDSAAACRLLSERARGNLESATRSSCPSALARLDLVASPVTSVGVWGDNAQARLGEGALFLAEFVHGWRVTAAGCTFVRDDLPYDCDVEG
jgi:hypothetical protein